MLKKASILLMAVVFLFTTVTFVGCGGSPKDKFLKDYENFMTKLEKAVDANDLTAIAGLEDEYYELDKRANEFVGDDDWTDADDERYEAILDSYNRLEEKLMDF